MLLLFLYWCYLFFTCITIGWVFEKTTRVMSNNFVVTVFLGLFSITFLSSFWAIFGRIGIEFQLFLLALELVIFIRFKSDLTQYYRSIWEQWKSLPKMLQLFLGSILLLTLVKSASPTTIIDNETYYVQTIKWLNEYGFIKGLGNLHFFFAQTSGWHILQSAMNFSFLTNNLNDLNGFCLFLVNVFAILFLKDHSKNKNIAMVWIGMLPFANIFFFQFITAPSPDLAVYLLSLLVFYYFIKDYTLGKIESFQLIFFLSIFVVYIKITALPILIFPLIFLLNHYKKLVSKMVLSGSIGLVLFSLFIIKNTILTGYPLFPTRLFKLNFANDYNIPDILYTFWFNPAKWNDFFISSKYFEQNNGFQIVGKWLFTGNSTSLFNGLVLIILIGIPFVLKRFFNQKTYWIVYTVMVVQFGFLWLTSPQYRFIFSFVLFFGFVLISLIIQKQKPIVLFLFGSLVPLVFLILFPLESILHKSNSIRFQQQSFSINNLIYPTSNSNLKATYLQLKIAHLDYFSPDESTYIWTSGDGNLPCVNSKQIDYFKNKLGIFPQQRTSNIRDGFYSKPTMHE